MVTKSEKVEKSSSSKSDKPSEKKEPVESTKGKKAPKSESALDKKTQVAPADAKPRVAKAHRYVSAGIAHITATFNNTLVTITDLNGGVIAWSSGGRIGFKGTRKSTAYAATIVAQDAARRAASYRLQEVQVRVQGPGSGRESAIRALQSAGLTINTISDVTPIPHNGCRPRKRRRV